MGSKRSGTSRRRARNAVPAAEDSRVRAERDGLERDAEGGSAAQLARLLTLEGALLRGLAGAEDLVGGLPFVMRAICDFAGFASGCYFSVDEVSRVLRRAAGCGEAAGAGSLVDGQALPAWLEDDPVFIAGGASENEQPAAWRSTLIVPVAAGGALLGALEFAVTGRTAPDAYFLQVLRGVAVQLGHLHARAAAAERLRESESRFASTMALAAIGISHVDDDGRFLYVNPQLCRMLGYSEAELLERTVKDISHPEDIGTTEELSSRLRQGSIASFKAEKRYLRKDGSVVWAGLTVALKRDRDGRKLYDVSIVEDISARKEAERCIQYLANHDALTGLPNRSRFAQLLAAACDAARRDRRRFAVLFVDLDGFKPINDTLGHEAGDAMLRATAGRLRGCVRASDVVARLGGDEFVVLLQDVAEASIAGKVATNVLRALAEPVAIEGRDCTVSASIGICLHPDGNQEDQAVLRNADMAMYLAKQSGKNGYRVYVNELNALSAERAELQAQLRHALEHESYQVRFDACVDAKTSAVVALEACVQWTSAELAAAAPAKLRSAAEAAGLLVQINQRLLRAACQHAATWQRAGLAPITVAVGVSAGQINDPAFVAEVRETLLRTGLDASLLELDASEEALLYDAGRAVRTLAALRALGVRIAIAAFGSGKVSFADLQRFPLSALKLDEARVSGIGHDVDKQRYAEGVLALGGALGLAVIATGVSDPVDAEYLRDNGCTKLQGLIAPRGLTAAECEAVLRAAG